MSSIVPSTGTSTRITGFRTVFVMILSQFLVLHHTIDYVACSSFAPYIHNAIKIDGVALRRRTTNLFFTTSFSNLYGRESTCTESFGSCELKEQQRQHLRHHNNHKQQQHRKHLRSCGNGRKLYSIVPTNKMFPQSVYDSIENGQIAVVPEFLSRYEIDTLRRDAMDLHSNGYFTSDALSSYGNKEQFDPSKDRNVLKLQQWNDKSIGDSQLRTVQLGGKIADIRTDLSYHLHRPKLVEGCAATKYGIGSTEISYTCFSPGASLSRHVDEHHEELKGVAGWYQPTRRSLSWLIYINDRNSWDPNLDGGTLRCYERRFQPPSHRIGSRNNGDLQIGWLLPTMNDPHERPVFMASLYDRSSSSSSSSNNNNNNIQNHQCALYIDNDFPSTNKVDRLYVSKPFPANPTLYLAGASEYILQKMYIARQLNIQQSMPTFVVDVAERFRFIEAPRSRFFASSSSLSSAANNEYEIVHDISPVGGTLVVFDSVTLPHEVLPSLRQQRWACSGWMHEDQQPMHSL